MPVTIRETIFWLEHLRRAACRRIFHMKADAYMKRYSGSDVPVEICLDTESNPIICELCGFVILKATFAGGWQMEMCSALPLVDLDRPALRQWLTTLNGNSSNCQTDDFKPILQDK